MLFKVSDLSPFITTAKYKKINQRTACSDSVIQSAAPNRLKQNQKERIIKKKKCRGKNSSESTHLNVKNGHTDERTKHERDKTPLSPTTIQSRTNISVVRWNSKLAATGANGPATRLHATWTRSPTGYKGVRLIRRIRSRAPSNVIGMHKNWSSLNFFMSFLSSIS